MLHHCQRITQTQCMMIESEMMKVEVIKKLNKGTIKR